MLVGICVCFLSQTASAFHLGAPRLTMRPTTSQSPRSSLTVVSGYSRQQEQEIPTAKANPLYPKVGDIVRYYEMDGGRVDGQVLVGKD